MSVSFDDFIVDVRSWLNLDADDAPTQLISNWVRATEAQIYRTLRIQLNQLSTDIPAAGNVYTLPSDLRSVQTVELIADGAAPADLTRESRARVQAARKVTSSLTTYGPYNYCLGNSREVWLGGIPADGSTIRITGHGFITLQGEEGFGVVPAEIYDVYLWGTLATASSFYSNDADTMKYEAKMAVAIQAANAGESNL